MGRVLALTLRSVHLLASLRERQALLERLRRCSARSRSAPRSRRSSSRSSRAAGELLGDEIAVLRLIDPENPAFTDLVASGRRRRTKLRGSPARPRGQGAAGTRSPRAGRASSRTTARRPRRPRTSLDGACSRRSPRRSSSAASIVGSLVVAHPAARTALPRQRAAARLAVFAEHAGLALNDAKAAEETAHQAFHDSLTGLANRALFLDRLHQARARGDAQGAMVGGAVRRPRRLQDRQRQPRPRRRRPAADHRRPASGPRIRPMDTVARFGGDEFAILIEDVTGPIDRRAAGPARAGGAREADRDPGRDLFITASIGVAAGLEAPGGAAAQRRPGDVRGEGGGEGPLRDLPPPDAPLDDPAAGAGARPPEAERPRPVRPPLPADRRPRELGGRRASRRWSAGSTQDAG